MNKKILFSSSLVALTVLAGGCRNVTNNTTTTTTTTTTTIDTAHVATVDPNVSLPPLAPLPNAAPATQSQPQTTTQSQPAQPAQPTQPKQPTQPTQPQNSNNTADNTNTDVNTNTGSNTYPQDDATNASQDYSQVNTYHPPQQQNQTYDYYAELAPYGTWQNIDGQDGFVLNYGYEHDQFGQPYTPYRHGTWYWSDYGYGQGQWVWNGYDRWDAITGHFGHWRHHRYWGWVWFPFQGAEYTWHASGATLFFDNDGIGWSAYYDGVSYSRFDNDWDDGFAYGGYDQYRTWGSRGYVTAIIFTPYGYFGRPDANYVVWSRGGYCYTDYRNINNHIEYAYQNHYYGRTNVVDTRVIVNHVVAHGVPVRQVNMAPAIVTTGPHGERITMVNPKTPIRITANVTPAHETHQLEIPHGVRVENVRPAQQSTVKTPDVAHWNNAGTTHLTPGQHHTVPVPVNPTQQPRNNPAPAPVNPTQQPRNNPAPAPVNPTQQPRNNPAPAPVNPTQQPRNNPAPAPVKPADPKPVNTLPQQTHTNVAPAPVTIAPAIPPRQSEPPVRLTPPVQTQHTDAPAPVKPVDPKPVNTLPQQTRTNPAPAPVAPPRQNTEQQVHVNTPIQIEHTTAPAPANPPRQSEPPVRLNAPVQIQHNNAPVTTPAAAPQKEEPKVEFHPVETHPVNVLHPR